MRTYIEHPEQERVESVAERLGRNLRTARKNRHWTQEEVAAKIGVSRPTYRAIEEGKPTVSIGHLISAFVAVGLEDGFLAVGSPDNDLVGLAINKRGTRKIDNDF